MRKLVLFAALFSLFLIIAGFARQQNAQLERKQLRSMLEQLGYELKDIVTTPGEEKVSFVLVRDELDIPIGAEISGNNAYIWYTVNLGEAQPDSSNKHALLLKENAKVQPSHFYISSRGLLMMGLAIENRNVTNAMLRQRAESIAANVAKTREIWEKK
ncbi:MAG TPA: hypothetical protein VM328_07655 [Fimbriimonadaceae bacterium]|nr:hypothetical protein [Fimbriimonadaceae bacterium]